MSTRPEPLRHGLAGPGHDSDAGQGKATNGTNPPAQDTAHGR
jgi:hypothetical protein